MREEPGPRPSSHAAERLATDVGAEMADLRTTLRSALDEAERLQAVGRNDLAVDVLQEQRDTLAAVHQQLTERLAAAAVEREAEHILEMARPEPSAPASVVDHRDGTVLRLLASSAAAVAGIALLLVPELGGGALQAAGWGQAHDASVPAAEATPPSTPLESIAPTGPPPATGAATSRRDDETVDGAVAPGATPTTTAPTPPDGPTPRLHPDRDLLEQVVEAIESRRASSPAPTEEGLRNVSVEDPDGGESAERER